MRSLVLILLIILAFASQEARAQGNCAERAIVTEHLASKFGEDFAGGGLRNAQSIFEVWVSHENGTWTIIQTQADGTSCVMASGTHWRDALPESPIGAAS